MAAPRKIVLQRAPDPDLVVHDQQPERQRGRRRNAMYRGHGGRWTNARKLHRERRARPKLATHGDRPLVIRHETVDDAEPETRALTRPLGREERIEDAIEIFRPDPRPRIRHLDKYARALTP